MIRTTRKGIDELQKRVGDFRNKKLKNKIRVSIQTRDTYGRQGLKKNSVKRRSAKTNAIIFNKRTMDKTRNPVFFRAKDIRFGERIWHNAIKKFVAGDATVDRFTTLLKPLGNFMVDTIQKHIIKGQTEAGYQRPLQKRYAAIKEEIFGKQPILKRTGQLLDSLIYKVRVR